MDLRLLKASARGPMFITGLLLTFGFMKGLEMKRRANLSAKLS